MLGMFVDLGFEACSCVALTVNMRGLKSQQDEKNIRKTDGSGLDSGNDGLSVGRSVHSFRLKKTDGLQ